eukprot:4534054-Alexandrium_andersonii.AAC.1
MFSGSNESAATKVHDFNKNPTSGRAQMGRPNAHVQSRVGSGGYRAESFGDDVSMISGFCDSANPESHGNVQNTPFYGEEVAVVAQMSVHPDFNPGPREVPVPSSKPRRFPYAGRSEPPPDHFRAKALCASARGPPADGGVAPRQVESDAYRAGSNLWQRHTVFRVGQLWQIRNFPKTSKTRSFMVKKFP